MRAALLAALTATGCRIDLDRQEPRLCEIRDQIQVCVQAATHSDFEWIQDNIFTSNCSGDDCHGDPPNGQAKPGGEIQLTPGMAYQTLLGADGIGAMSILAPDRRLVVPGNAEASYLFFLMSGIRKDQGEPRPFVDPPDDVGYMPQNLDPLCCQKIDAIGRWIEAGARPPMTN